MIKYLENLVPKTSSPLKVKFEVLENYCRDGFIIRYSYASLLTVNYQLLMERSLLCDGFVDQETMIDRLTLVENLRKLKTILCLNNLISGEYLKHFLFLLVENMPL